MAVKRFRLSSNAWQLLGLAVLAVITFGVVAYALVPQGAPTADTRPAAAAAVTPAVTEPPAPKPTVAFIGDSYSAGTGTTLTENRWTSVLSRDQGWTEGNFARGGTGYVTTVGRNAQAACGLDYCESYLEMVPQIIAAKPDMVIVSGGRNDRGMSRQVAANVASVFAELRKGLPDAEIIAFNPIWADGDLPAGAGVFGQAVADAATAAGGKFVDIGQPYQGKPDLIADDALHPNDAGHAELAAVTAAALKAAGIS